MGKIKGTLALIFVALLVASSLWLPATAGASEARPTPVKSALIAVLVEEPPASFVREAIRKGKPVSGRNLLYFGPETYFEGLVWPCGAVIAVVPAPEPETCFAGLRVGPNGARYLTGP